MASLPDDEAFLKSVHGQFADAPLKPGDPRYEPLHEVLGDTDPVALMGRHIAFNDPESIQLFSGFRGSGKTTELLRLKGLLEASDHGYFVLYADALEYMNPAEPVDISSLLMALAGSFSDALEQRTEIDLAYEPFWVRALNYIAGTGLNLQEIGIKTGVDLKLQIKTTPSFRDDLQKFLSTRIGELKARVDRFFEDGLKAIRAKHGDATRVVFIFDQLEQLRGTYQNWQSVIRSVDELFSVHIDRLRIPYVHAVYAVPPWLAFLRPSEEPTRVLPTVHLWNNDTDRSPFAPAWDAYRKLIGRRLTPADSERLFGPDPAAGKLLTDRLIAASAGQVRDLLRLMRESLMRTAALPVTVREVDQAINSARRDLTPLALDDARWLADIGRQRDTALRSVDERSVERLSHFLDTHLVLFFLNDQAWYDTHPLLRDEIARVIAGATPVMDAAT